MKTITIRQPHVAAIFAGLKRYETRSWRTIVRGEVAIHAGSRLDSKRCRFIETMEDWGALDVKGRDELTRGAIIGMVEIVDCIPTSEVPSGERDWGDFSEGRWAWVLKNPRTFKTPIPAAGRLMFWEFDESQTKGAKR